MPIRDLLQAQIEQMGQAIGKMISKFLGLKNDGKMEEAMAESEDVMRRALNLDFKELCEMESNGFELFFQDKPYSSESFETLSNYFYEVGIFKIKDNSEGGRVILKKAILLLDLADQAEDSFSMTRMGKREEIEGILCL